MDGETVMVVLASWTPLLAVMVEVADQRLRDRVQRNTSPSAGSAVTSNGVDRDDPTGRTTPTTGSVDPAARMAAMQPNFLVSLNVFNTEFETVVRYVERRDASRVEAEDAAQHAFVQLWKEVAKGRGAGSANRGPGSAGWR
ncbi:hypothetical protein [Streptomyces sp. G45]|uniref:hypothetical protein n=1 Tax=Streptomyces sp. G45 TaxID=3406627 RepID=UPI003C1A77F3